MLSFEEANRLFEYNPETGVIVRKISVSNAKAGSIAGRKAKDGYRQISFQNKYIQAHRIVWLIAYGSLPGGEIDHINGVRDDNRLSNLRDVSRKDNQMNLRVAKSNKSGVTGVVTHKGTGKWQASIQVSGKCIYLGLFDDFSDAVLARTSAQKEHGFHENHGLPKGASHEL